MYSTSATPTLVSHNFQTAIAPFLTFASIRHIQGAGKSWSLSERGPFRIGHSTSSAQEAEVHANSCQHYDTCVQAANHITRVGKRSRTFEMLSMTHIFMNKSPSTASTTAQVGRRSFSVTMSLPPLSCTLPHVSCSCNPLPMTSF